MTDQTSKKTMSDNTGRFLEFNLGSEKYAIPLLKVREVISIPETTPIPKAPGYFRGIMNLRGHVISIVDLRMKLGVEMSGERPQDEAVVILDFAEFHVGVIVDSVNKVLTVDDSEVSDLPVADTKIKSDYIMGVYKREGDLVLLVDVVQALDLKDLVLIKESLAS